MWYRSMLVRLTLLRTVRTPRPRQLVLRPHVELLEERHCPSSYTITNLGSLGGTAASSASAIKNVGQVAGVASTAAAGVEHAYLWTQGATNGVRTNPQMRDLGTLPGLPDSAAVVLNNAGQVVGVASASLNGPEFDGCFWNGATMTDLGSLGGLLGSGTVSVTTTKPGLFPNTQAVQTISVSGTITGGTFT